MNEQHVLNYHNDGDCVMTASAQSDVNRNKIPLMLTQFWKNYNDF